MAVGDFTVLDMVSGNRDFIPAAGKKFMVIMKTGFSGESFLYDGVDRSQFGTNDYDQTYETTSYPWNVKQVIDDTNYLRMQSGAYFNSASMLELE